MFCICCGQQLPDGADFCTACGTPVEREAQADRAFSGEAGHPGYTPPYVQAGNAPRPPMGMTTPVQGGYAVPAASTPDPRTRVAAPKPARAGGSGEKKYIAAIVAVVVAALVAILAIGMVAGLFGSGNNPSGSTPPPSAAGGGKSDSSSSDSESSRSEASDNSTSVEIRKSVDDYSWEELSQISDMIAKADDADIDDIVRDYNLVNGNGKLDGSQVKSVKLEDGTKARAQIIGFAHDSKSSSGISGITFMFEDCVADHVFNGNGSNAGGWKGSEIRSWLNGDFYYRLPSELRDVIVEVDKDTNNEGKTAKVSAVTTTSDKLWLPSFVEIVGKITMSAYESAYEPVKGDLRSTFQSYFDIWNAEGSQYELFADRKVVMGRANAALVKDFLPDSVSSSLRKGVACDWWGRSSSPGEPDRVQTAASDGSPRKSTSSPRERLGVAPCFCI